MGDTVDDIVAAWTAVRPDLDVTAIGPTTRVRRLARHLDVIRERSLARHGLNSAALDLLSTLRRAGPPHRLSVREVRRRVLVTAGAISMRIDRAEASGWVRREPDAEDRRRVLIALTPRGVNAVDAAVTDIAAAESALLRSLDPAQVGSLDAALRPWLVAAAQATHDSSPRLHGRGSASPPAPPHG